MVNPRKNAQGREADIFPKQGGSFASENPIFNFHNGIISAGFAIR
jgi:hypothetical protein